MQRRPAEPPIHGAGYSGLPHGGPERVAARQQRQRIQIESNGRVPGIEHEAVLGGDAFEEQGAFVVRVHHDLRDDGRAAMLDPQPDLERDRLAGARDEAFGSVGGEDGEARDGRRPLASLASARGLVRRGDRRALVHRDHVAGLAVGDDASGLQQQHAVAETLHGAEIVRDEDDRRAPPPQVEDALDAARLERCIADRQHLVDEQHVGLELRGHGKAEPYVHARRVPFHRHVEELADAGELDDAVEPGGDVTAAETEDGAAEEDVLAARQFGVETGAHLD